MFWNSFEIAVVISRRKCVGILRLFFESWVEFSALRLAPWANYRTVRCCLEQTQPSWRCGGTARAQRPMGTPFPLVCRVDRLWRRAVSGRPSASSSNLSPPRRSERATRAYLHPVHNEGRICLAEGLQIRLSWWAESGYVVHARTHLPAGLSRAHPGGALSPFVISGRGVAGRRPRPGRRTKQQSLCVSSSVCDCGA